MHSQFSYMQAKRKTASLTSKVNTNLHEDLIDIFRINDSIHNNTSSSSNIIDDVNQNESLDLVEDEVEEVDENRSDSENEEEEEEEKDENNNILTNNFNDLWKLALHNIVSNCDDNIEDDSSSDEDNSPNYSNANCSSKALNRGNGKSNLNNERDSEGDNRHNIDFQRLLDFDIMSDISKLIQTMIFNVKSSNRSENTPLYSVGPCDSPFTSGIVYFYFYFLLFIFKINI
jgi:hypothetical protein